MASVQSAVDQLNAFADADSVKEFLKLTGIKGYRQDETSCPISQWISHVSGYSVSTEDKITVCVGDWGIDEHVIAYETSDAVKQFITNFDLGQYPELDVDDGDMSPWL